MNSGAHTTSQMKTAPLLIALCSILLLVHAGAETLPECRAKNPLAALNADKIAAIAIVKDLDDLEKKPASKLRMSSNEIQSTFNELKRLKPAWEGPIIGYGLWPFVVVLFDHKDRPLAYARYDISSAPYAGSGLPRESLTLYLLEVRAGRITDVPRRIPPPPYPRHGRVVFPMQKEFAKQIFALAKKSGVVPRKAKMDDGDV